MSIGARSCRWNSNDGLHPKNNTLSLSVLRHKFDQYDTNHDGALSPMEAAAALTSIGGNITFDMLDKDGSGSIEFEEFAVMSTVMGHHTHPIFKKSLDRLQETQQMTQKRTTIEDYATHKEMFDRVAAKAWRKLCYMRTWTEVELVSCFTRLDTNGDHFLSEVQPTPTCT